MGETDLPTLLTAVALAVTTVLTRGFFLLSSRSWELPRWAQRGLQYAPIAALAAVVVPEVAMPGGVLVDSWHNARLLAAVAGALWFAWQRSLLGTIVVGMAVYLPLHLGLGW